MLTNFGLDFDRSFAMMDDLRRRMDRLWDDFDRGAPVDGTLWGTSTALASAAVWPRLNLFDAGANLVLVADVPGVSEQELQVVLNDGVLSLSGERKANAPDGYSVHRQERGAMRFSRSVTLPCKVDGEKTAATVKDGVLTVTIAKSAEAQPRQITLRVS